MTPNTPTTADVDQALGDVGAQLERALQAAGPEVQRDAYRQAAQHARRLWSALEGLAAPPPT